MPASPTTPGDLTFQQFAERWQSRARAQQSANQQANDKGIIKRLSALELAPGEHFGDRPIRLVTLDDVQLAFGTLGVTAGSTWNKYRQALLLMQRWGVKHQYLTRLWVVDLKDDLKRQRSAKRERRLIPDTVDGKGVVSKQGEERRLLVYASPWLQRLIIAALETGCRRGELLSLQWMDVNLAAGELTIRAEKAKTGTMRHLPLSPRLKAVLQLIANDPTGAPHQPTAFVFGNVIGEQIGSPKKAWATACKTAGITGLHFHDLRHEAGSRLLEAGWPLHHVQEMLGHADVKTTSVYLNPTRQGLQQSMRKFGISGQPLHDVAQTVNQEHPPPGNDQRASASKPLVN
jgi:integrase